VGAGRTSRPVAGQPPAHGRFYAGGFQSLRGFAFRGVGPDSEGFKVGGDFLFLNSIEYQVPVRADETLYFMNFLDSGTVERNVSVEGRKFRTEVVPGTQTQRYTTTFREPFLFDRPSRPGVNSDAGLVGGIILNERNFDIQRPARDVPNPDQPPAGPGVRIQVPSLGPVPVELNFGFPVFRGQQDREQVFSFWLGFFA
jgi:outer membrane protein assembly factor BamA